MKRMIALAAVLLACTVAVAVAQEPEAPLTGKLYLADGTTYEGVIEVAEFGVVEGAGIGTGRSPTNDYMSIEVADVPGEQVRVPVGDIAAIEATWEQAGPEGAKKWQVQELTITRKDGTKVSGKLHWLLHETTVVVHLADGTIIREYAFPVASAEFDPAKLLVKVELGPVAMPDTTPAQPDTTPAQPDTTPAPPDTTPAQPDTTPAQPDTTPAQPDTTPAQPDTTPAQPDTTPAQPAGAGATVGAPSTITLTVVCPKCGERIRVTITVTANSEE